jgi:hypothetical protein
MNTSISEAGKEEGAGGNVRVAVHEDYLFDVDIVERELAPVSTVMMPDPPCRNIRKVLGHSPHNVHQLSGHSALWGYFEELLLI